MIVNSDAISLGIMASTMDRNIKRQTEREFDNIFNNLKFINDSFLAYLFSDINNSYKDIYIKHHNMWNHYCDYLKNTLKPKFLVINYYWFSEQYKPIESI